jgi:hypothetical protein
MKKHYILIAVIAFVVTAQNAYAQEKKLEGIDFGLQFSALAEIGFFMTYQFIYYGVGFNFWEPNDFEGDPYWNDVTFRLGYAHKFKMNIGVLAGIQGRLLSVRSNYGGSVSLSTASGYSSSANAEWHFIFMPEIGVSYTWKVLYGNIAYQLDTNNIKNSTVCFVVGVTL